MKILNILSNVLISALLSGPFLVLGGLLVIDSGDLSGLSLAVLLVGLGILGIGLYVSCSAVAPEPPLQETETEQQKHTRQSGDYIQTKAGHTKIKTK